MHAPKADGRSLSSGCATAEFSKIQRENLLYPAIPAVAQFSRELLGTVALCILRIRFRSRLSSSRSYAFSHDSAPALPSVYSVHFQHKVAYVLPNRSPAWSGATC